MSNPGKPSPKATLASSTKIGVESLQQVVVASRRYSLAAHGARATPGTATAMPSHRPIPLVDRLRLLLDAACLAAAACRKRATDATTLRLGSFPNLTLAPALTGVTSGRFARALGSTRLEHHAFNVGPAAIEALMAGALDATFVGPIPAAAGFVRSYGAALTVVAGAWPKIDFTADALTATVETAARRSPALGRFPSYDLRDLFDDPRIARART